MLEGFHPLKHALRFDAAVLEVYTDDAEQLQRLAAGLAPDLRERIGALARPIDTAVFERLAPLPPSTRVISLAERPLIDAASVLRDSRPSPIVLLEDPRDLGNMGASVRVCAAADIAGVLTTGSHDPWHPDALGEPPVSTTPSRWRGSTGSACSARETGRSWRWIPRGSRWTPRRSIRAPSSRSAPSATV